MKPGPDRDPLPDDATQFRRKIDGYIGQRALAEVAREKNLPNLAKWYNGTSPRLGGLIDIAAKTGIPAAYWADETIPVMEEGQARALVQRISAAIDGEAADTRAAVGDDLGHLLAGSLMVQKLRAYVGSRSVAQAARAAGIEPKALERMLDGGLPSMRALRKLAEHIGTHADYWTREDIAVGEYRAPRRKPLKQPGTACASTPPESAQEMTLTADQVEALRYSAYVCEQLGILHRVLLEDPTRAGAFLELLRRLAEALPRLG